VIERFAIIIGSMKSGTTTLANNLGRHPAVALSNPKEPGFFAFDDVFEKGADWYEGLFRFDPAVHRVALEGSTDYTKFPFCPQSAERIRAFGRDMRLIFMMRHPLRRIESHARHVQGAGRELGMTNSDRPDHSLDAGVSPVNLAASQYASQLERYRDFFEAGRLKLFTLERLESHPEDVLREACAYLDLDPSRMPLEVTHENRAKTIARAPDAGPLWKAAASLGPVTGVMKRLVPQKMKADLYNRLRPEKKVVGRFKLTQEEEMRLAETLASDLRRLRDDFGVDAAKEWGMVL
jgi:hypothetical protein